MSETVDIINTIVSGINKTFTAKNIVDNGDGTYTLNTCDTLYLQEKFILSIDSIDYLIETIGRDSFIKISGPTLPTLLTFEIYSAHYFHGTVIKTKNEIEVVRDMDGNGQLAIVPFIYLKEILSDTNFREGNGSPFSKESDLQLFYMTSSNFTDWKTTDHYEKSIVPMNRLVELFLDSAERSGLVGDFFDDPDTTTPRVNFGVNTVNGNTKALFVDQLSGIQQKIKLKFYKQSCKNCS